MDFRSSGQEALQESWDRLRKALAEDLPEHLLGPIRPIRLPTGKSDSRLVLGVTERGLLPELRQFYQDPIRLRLASLLGREVRVEFRDAGEVPEQTFATFVSGDCNRLACSAAEQLVRDSEVRAPLYLHGAAGLGKTHLCRAVENAVRDGGRFPFYIDGPRYAGRLAGIPDVLIVDSLDGAGGSPRARRLSVVIRECHDRGTQVLVTGRLPLKQLDDSGGIRALLDSGLQVRLLQPEPAVRRRFLGLELAAAGLDSPKMLELLAQMPADSFRDMQSAVRKLSFLSRENSLPATPSGLLAALGHAALTPGEAIAPERVLEAVCLDFGVDPDEVLSSSRKSKVTLPRHTAMVLAVELTGLNKSAVARFFRRNDHSTVINAEKNIRRRSAEDAAFRERLTALRDLLQTGA